MQNHLHFAVFLEEGTNPIEFNYSRLRLMEAGIRTTVVGRERLDYRLEDHSLAHADILSDELEQYRFDGVLMLTTALEGRTITCASQMRDDIIHSVDNVEYRDQPVVLDGNILTGQGTEDLPQFMQTFLGGFARE